MDRQQQFDNLTRLRAHNDATNNYYAYNFIGTYDFHRVYIDTDEVASTGFSHCGLGANYLLENSSLYQYSGTGSTWSWTLVGNVTANIGTSSASWTVARSSIGEAAFPNRARMCFETETDVLHTSAIYTHVYTNETLPIHAHVASNDDTTIYYQATFDIQYKHKHVFIDVDENAATGYSAGGIGAEYMIENDSLYRYTGNGSTWSWTSLGSANMSPSTVGATGVTTWSIARSTIGETGTAERADLVFHGNPAAGGSSTYTAIYDHVYSGGTVGGGTTVDNNYVPDTDLLKNPERGMYYGEPLEPGDDDYDTSWIVAEWLWLAPACHDNLVWDPTNPNPGATSPVLKKYAEEKLDKARSEGYKILFRPRYDDENAQGKLSDGCTYLINGVPVFHADSLERQKNHIDAVAAMLGDYKDVIAFIQAGYLGAWGEWNDGDFDKVNVPLLYTRPDRRDIIDHVLSAYAAEGIAQDVELRRPVFAKEVVVRNASANVGLHNDCFMSSDNDDPSKNSDSGTYSHFFDFLKFSDLTASSDLQNLSEDLGGLATEDDARKWACDWTEHSSFGGETCPSNGNERWRFCDNMTGDPGDPGEPAKLHLCYLNHDYADDAVEEWQKGDCYDDIRRNLGYRFEVTCVEYTETVSAGDTFSVAVDVENNGWARLHKPRDAKLVLRNGATPPLEYTFSGGPVSNWAPGTKTTISVSDSAPPPGTYRVWLGIPDPDLLEFLSTAPNPEDYEKAKTNYAVKLATLRDGKNVFDPDTAENDLGVFITVQ